MKSRILMSDYEKGLETRRKILGDEWVDRSLSNRNAFNSEFQSFITRYVWDEVWNRPGLDHKTRRYMVLSTMMALGRWEEFRLHIGAAMRVGFNKDDIKEVIIQQAVYCGVASGNHAMVEAQRVFDEMKI
jgi:4-carboxymuconolactone decarboxylase